MLTKILSGAVVALSFASMAQAEHVEIALEDALDGNLSGYCLDIAGAPGANANPANGLQAHTCYSYRGALEVDQIFDTDRLAEGVLYMPEFDVCATLSAVETGATVGLAACDGSTAQNITLTENGQLSPAGDATLCLTAGEETRMGRGGTSPHQIKALTVETCSAENAPYQTWYPRTSGGE